jgi:hypothetical protein
MAPLSRARFLCFQFTDIFLPSFAAFGIFTITTTYFFIPDYTGRSHAQIDELFLRKIPARKVRIMTSWCHKNLSRWKRRPALMCFL